jgi:hypothetical protein
MKIDTFITFYMVIFYIHSYRQLLEEVYNFLISQPNEFPSIFRIERDHSPVMNREDNCL